MTKSYAQSVVDDYFLEGDLDYHFFYEFFSKVNVRRYAPFGMFDVFSLEKSKAQQFNDALTLSRFFIESGSYVGFYFHNANLKKPYCRFENFDEYEKFVKERNSLIPEYGLSEADVNGYSLGVVKIKDGAQAPSVTSEIEAIFSVPDQIAKKHKQNYYGS